MQATFKKFIKGGVEIAREEKVRVRACVWNGKELGLQGEGKEADKMKDQRIRERR